MKKNYNWNYGENDCQIYYEIKLGKEDREYLEKVIEILDKHPYRDWRKVGIV